MLEYLHNVLEDMLWQFSILWNWMWWDPTSSQGISRAWAGPLLAIILAIVAKKTFLKNETYKKVILYGLLCCSVVMAPMCGVIALAVIYLIKNEKL